MVGRSIGPYAVLERLGSGGMGDVFLAEDRRLHRRVALKQLREASASPESHRALLREARAAAALNHPNIASIHDVVEDGDTVCIVMEYVEGQSLHSCLAHGPLPVEQAIAVGRQVVDALAAAHAGGVLHCDLKPANVILTPAGRVKVLDFGLAQRFALPTAETTTASFDHTVGHAGKLAGTAGYMAPERLTGAALSPRSDIYSAGVVMFEMLTGRKPFGGSDLITTAMAALTEPVPSASQLNPNVPEAVSAAVTRALSRDPQQRFATASEFGEELTRLSNPRSAVSQLHRKHRSPAFIIIAAVTIALAAWLVIRTARPSAPPTRVAARSSAVAIPPFANRSGLAADDPLGVGIADDLTTRLAELPAITVVSRSSTASYIAEHPNSRSLARDLGVAYVIEGSLQKTGDRLHVNVTLARPDGSVAWGRTYDGTAGDLFALQQQIAQSVADALAERVDATISTSDRQRLAVPPTRNMEAFADYSQGQMFLQRQDTKDSVDRAIVAFQRAIAKDVRFASAYAGLGAAYWMKYRTTNDAAFTARALDATLEAQRLDPLAAGVHVYLGQIYLGMGRTDSAIEELRRALALHPNEPDAHRLLGGALAEKGLVDEAIREYHKGIALMPDYFRNHQSLGWTLLANGRLEEAAAAFKRVTELQPDIASGYDGLGVAQMQMDSLQDGLASFSRALQIEPNDSWSLSNTGTIEYWLGRFREAKRAYQRCVEMEPASAAAHRNIADAMAQLGEKKGARNEYEKALALTLDELNVNPKNITALTRAAVVEAELGRVAEARRYADQALTASSKSSDALFASAVVHALSGENQQALERMKQAIDAGYSKVYARYDDNLFSLRALPQYHAVLDPPRTPGSQRH